MKNKTITRAEVEKIMNTPFIKEFRQVQVEFLEKAKEELKEKFKMKRKIKLRDLTAKQWNDNMGCECNKYKDCNGCRFRYIDCSTSNFESSWINHKEIFNDKFLNQEIEIEEPDILDKQEKEYLRAVIKPFRNRILNIRKCSINFWNCGTPETKIYYYIEIEIKSRANILHYEYIKLPYFRNEMYEGMVKNKSYTLEDLDL